MSHLSALLYEKSLIENEELSLEDDVEKMLEDNSLAIKVKVDNIVYVLGKLDSIQQYYKDEKDRLTTLQKKAEAMSKSIKKRIATVIKAEELHGSMYKIKAVLSVTHSVIPERVLPEDKLYVVTMTYEAFSKFREWSAEQEEGFAWIVKEQLPTVTKLPKSSNAIEETVEDTLRVSELSQKDLLKK